jgi:hypothetical protein
MIVVQRLGSKADGAWSQPLAICARCLECFWTTYAPSRHSSYVRHSGGCRAMAVGTWSRPLTIAKCQGQEDVEFYFYASLRLDVLKVIFTFVGCDGSTRGYIVAENFEQTPTRLASHTVRVCCSAFPCTSLIMAGLHSQSPRHFSWELQRGSQKPDGPPTSVTWFQLLRVQKSTGTSATLSDWRNTDLRAHDYTHSPNLWHQSSLANVTCASILRLCGINPAITDQGGLTND